VTGQQLQLPRPVVLYGCRQLRVRERGTGNRERVDAVGLAVGACALARPGHQLRRDPHDPLIVLEQEALEAAADAADIFQRPQELFIDRARPREQLRVPARPRLCGQLVDELAARRAHGNGGVRLLVRVDSDDERHDFPFVCLGRKRSSSGHASIGAGATLLSGHAGDPRTATVRQNRCWSISLHLFTGEG
jgi:hypothetical protein